MWIDAVWIYIYLRFAATGSTACKLDLHAY